MGKKLITLVALVSLGGGSIFFTKYNPFKKSIKSTCNSYENYEYLGKGEVIKTFDKNCNELVFSTYSGNHKNTTIKIGGLDFNFPRHVISLRKKSSEAEKGKLSYDFEIDYYDMKKDGILDAIVIKTPNEEREYIRFKKITTKTIHAKTSYEEKQRTKVTCGIAYAMFVDGKRIFDKELKGECKKRFNESKRKFRKYQKIFNKIKKREIETKEKKLDEKILDILIKDKKYFEEN